jgi:molybdopterin/thiamine biosynthesis adenylyltransferase/rhodanese-related sulfurtransferase
MKPESTAIETLPQQAQALQSAETPLLDIRSEQERMVGTARYAVACSNEEILSRARSRAANRLVGGYIICAGGVRSRTLVGQLRQEGFDGFFSVAGGFKAWREANLPADYPSGMDAASSERYARHLVMPQVGPDGQKKLLGSRVLLVGMGGLSSPAALYLAAAGVGSLGLVDDDRVERSNLQRQILHSDDSVGQLKVRSARKRIKALNPAIETELFQTRVDESNARDLLANWHIIMDGSDNFPTRYALNDACLQLGLPLIYGAVMRFQGQVSVFWPGQDAGQEPCYRCLFPKAPSEAEAPNCAVAGVLGVMPGIIGTLQACEALKLILGIGQPLIGRLLMIDALNMEFREARIRRDPSCPVCSSRADHGGHAAV